MANIVNLREEKEESKDSSESSLPQDESQKKEKLKKLPQTAVKNRLEWSAPEFFYFEKTEIWFIVSGLIALILFISALWTRNILFALLIFLGYFSITIYAIKKPRNIVVNINPQGIKIDNTLYPYDNLKSFWIFYEPPTLKEISLLSKKTIMPHIKIPIGEQDPAEVRGILIQYLSEKKQDESLVDNMTRQLRF